MSEVKNDEPILDLEVRSLDEMHKTLVAVDDPAEERLLEDGPELEAQRCSHSPQREMLSQPFPSE